MSPEFIYNIGALLVAGSDVSYEVNLVCSNDNSCKNIDGYTNGYCDCFHKGMEEKYTIASGSLNSGETYNEEIFEVVKNSDVRYDKAEITYEYVDNDGNTRIENSSIQVSELGGETPADCFFDVEKLFFHCEFEWGEEVCVKFTDGPTLGQEVYRPGDMITISGKVDKGAQTSQSTDKYWMLVTLVNGDGNSEIKAERFDIGTYGTTDVGQENIPGWKVGTDLFRETGTISRVGDGLSIETSESSSTSIGLKAGEPTVEIKFEAKNKDGACTNAREYWAMVNVHDNSAKVKVLKDGQEVSDRTKISYMGDRNRLTIQYIDSAKSVTIKGSPRNEEKSQEESNYQCANKITISAPGGQGVEYNNLQMKITLHKGDSEGAFTPVVASCGGQESRYSVPFKVSQNTIEGEGTCISGVNTGACDCNNNGNKNEFTPRDDGEVKYQLDCDGSKYQWCYSGQCYNFPRCTESKVSYVEDECFYTDGDYKATCPHGYWYYDGECTDDEPSEVENSGSSGNTCGEAQVTAECKCRKADGETMTCRLGEYCVDGYGCRDYEICKEDTEGRCTCVWKNGLWTNGDIEYCDLGTGLVRENKCDYEEGCKSI